MGYGQIKRAPINLVKAAHVVASRVAGIVAPNTTNSVFDALREQQFRRGGGLGMASDPRKYFKSDSSFYAKTDMTMRMQEQQARFSPKTSRNTMFLPNQYPARQGVATPVGSNQESITADEFMNTLNGWQSQVAGAPSGSAGAVSGNTQYVDDNGWPVTLAGIIGSKMLSPAQLKAASIQNVSSMINVSGGNATQRTELQYMFQRMVLEGFVRGVDITKEVAKQGGVNISLKSAIGTAGLTIGISDMGLGQNVSFLQSWWDGHADPDKYTLFLHEIGHNLLGEYHHSNSVMASPYPGSVIKNGYDSMLNELFSSSQTGNKVPIVNNQTPVYDQSWYPELSAISPDKAAPTGNTTGTPSGAPAPSPVYTPGSTTINTTNTTNSPAQVNAPGASNSTIGGVGNAQVPNQNNTPVAGMLPDIAATKAFAAGMVDLSKSNSSQNTMDMAGALLKSG